MRPGADVTLAPSTDTATRALMGIDGLRLWRQGSARDRLRVGLGWGLSAVFCIATGLATVIHSWSGLPLSIGGMTLYLTVYPPLIVATWWALCFGWSWGAPLVYLSTFTLALYAGMPLPWALLFACANPLGLAVFTLGYRAIDLAPDLNSLGAWMYFALMAFVANVFGSSGALIWCYTNRIDRLGLLPIWQGWWLGGLVQTVALVGPLLMLTRPRFAAWLREREAFLAAPPREPRKLTLRLILLVVVAVLGYGAATLTLAEERVRNRMGLALPDPVESLLGTVWAFYWVSALIVIFIGFFGYRSFSHWNAANRRLLEELDQLARTDRLSGLLNRRAMEEVLNQQLQRWIRHGESAALLMVDIDHFKRINDRYGHATGDTAIRALSDRLRACLRGIDSASRWGGEEFLLLLPRQDAQGALALAERLREQLRGSGLQPAFTVSIGVSLPRPLERDWDAWLKRADHALYQAKHAGRDRVCLAE